MKRSNSFTSLTGKNAGRLARNTALSTARKQRTTRKIVLLGSKKSGKTSYLNRLIKGAFTTTYQSTVEDIFNIDYKYRGFFLNLDFIDTGGPFDFPPMRNLNIMSADAVLVFYEIDNPDSITEALTCLKIVRELRENDVLPVALIGTKKDLTDEKTLEKDREQIYEVISAYEAAIKHTVTSAKLNFQIQHALELVLDEVILSIRSTSLSHYNLMINEDEKKCCIM